MLRAFTPSTAALVAALSASAAAADEPPLLPLGTLHPPPANDDDDPLPPSACGSKPLPALKERLPFGPGELLSYDIALLGVRTGKVNVKVGEKIVVDGANTYALQAQAKTDGFLTVLGNFDARMVSWFNPSSLLPVRMANHVVVKQPFVDTPIESREDGAFAKGGLNARLRRSSKDGVVNKKSHLKSDADVVDILSVVYYLRAHELVDGSPFCFELYHRRRLWRIEGRVRGVDVVRAPIGAKRAHKLVAVVRRLGGKAPPPPRDVTAWISDDADRVPVLVSTPDKLGDVEVRLLSYARGRRLVAR